MKNIFLIAFIICLTPTFFAQSSNNKYSKALETRLANLSASDNILVWVYFTDKGNSTSFYLNNPQLVVSEKSLKRRAKVLGNNSALTFKDIPVNKEYITQLQSLGFKCQR
jgi:hypothetical protein